MYIHLNAKKKLKMFLFWLEVVYFMMMSVSSISDIFKDHNPFTTIEKVNFLNESATLAFLCLMET